MKMNLNILLVLIIVTISQAFCLSVIKRDVAAENVSVDGTEIDSRFGLSDVKDFLGTAKTKIVSGANKIVEGAEKVGAGAEKAYGYVKDNVLTGYDYIKRKVKPNKDGLDHDLDIRSDLHPEGITFPRSKRANNQPQGN